MSGRSPISSLGALAASLWFSEFSICRTAPAEFFLLQLKRGKNQKMDTADIRGSAFNDQQLRLKKHYILWEIKIVDFMESPSYFSVYFELTHYQCYLNNCNSFQKIYFHNITSLYLKILNISKKSLKIKSEEYYLSRFLFPSET